MPAQNPNQSSLFLMNVGGKLGSQNIDILGAQNGQSLARYDDYCIRELAFDIGVDPNALKNKMKSILSGIGGHEEDNRGGNNNKD
jgi:hypothetical protein